MASSTPQEAEALQSEVSELRSQLSEYRQLVEAIRNGNLDALVVNDPEGQRLAPLEQVENTYRRLIEEMAEGALVLSEEGVILYANQTMAGMLDIPLKNVIGSNIEQWFSPASRERFHASLAGMLQDKRTATRRDEFALSTAQDDSVPVQVSLRVNCEGSSVESISVVVTDLWERIQNEAIAEEERLSRAIFEQSTDAIMVCDRNHNVIKVSDVAYNLCDVSPLGRPFIHCYTLRDSSDRQLDVDDLLRMAAQSGGEEHIVRSSHHEFHVGATPLYGHNHEQLGSVITLTDVSALIRAEREARRARTALEQELEKANQSRRALLSVLEDAQHSEESLRKRSVHLRTLVQTMPDLVWLKDSNGVYRLCNPMFERLVGRNESRIIGCTDYDLFDSAEADSFSAHDRRVMQTGHVDTFEEWKTFLGVGYRGLFEITKKPMRDENGKQIGILGIAHDITERKKAEEELRLAATVFEQSREGIIVSDKQNRIALVNRAFSDITGFEGADVVGQNLYMPFMPGHDEDFYLEIWRSLDAEHYWQGELRNVRSNGDVYQAWLSITRTFDEDDAISGHIAVFDDITERKEYEDKIHQLAHFDSVTGLPNRILLADRSRNVISMAQRHHQQVALLYCDLDHFKNINDALGHDVGDRLLTEVAERLSRYLRQEDTVSRQGGDEFVILLPDTDSGKTANVCKKIQSVINEPYKIDEYELDISLSIGVALYPDDGGNFEMLSKNADIAMYRAKQTGRNNYCFFTPELQKTTARTLRLESDIRRALARGELLLYYQPQVSLTNGRIVGVEALLRWQHPEFGMVSPFEFITIAEYTGQIIPIGEWVIRTAVAALQSWMREGLPAVRMAVNLSVLQLRQPLLVDQVRSILKESGIEPGLLELEVTESMLMEEPDKVIDTLNRVNRLGIHIAIDDFGTGYSSLSYLKRMPLKYLKIDKTFTQDMLKEEDDAAIVRSIITLGHSLGLELIAEGVETPGQVDFLREHQCEYVQGYLFSKPLPEQELRGLLVNPEHVFRLARPRMQMSGG